MKLTIEELETLRNTYEKIEPGATLLNFGEFCQGYANAVANNECKNVYDYCGITLGNADESGAGGRWDLSGEMAKAIISNNFDKEELQEYLYNTLGKLGVPHFSDEITDVIFPKID